MDKMQYNEEVQKRWGHKQAYQEFSQKKTTPDMFEGMDSLMIAFAECHKDENTSDSDNAQVLVKQLQNYITENFYICTNEILAGLGQMYVGDERFRMNIDRHGEGTAAFISESIKIYCR